MTQRAFHVAIVQEHIPQYREDLFALLQNRLESQGIEIQVFAGIPSRKFAQRADSVTPGWLQPLKQREFSILGRRMTLRLLPRAALTSDLIILEHARRNLDAYILLLICPSRVGLWGHGRDYVHHRGPISRLLSRWMTRRASHYFAYTDGSRRAAIDAGQQPTRVTVVMNSKTLALPEPATPVRPMPGRGRVIFVGALEPEKRLPFLIRSLSIARASVPDLSLTVVGEGRCRPAMLAQYRQLDWVVFKGHLQGQLLGSELLASEAIGNPGRVGLVAVDSLLSGRPVFTTEGVRHAPEFEYLTDGETCVISADDEESYAASFVHAFANPELLIRLSSNALKEASAHTIEQAAENFAAGVSLVRNRTRSCSARVKGRSRR